jgi:hypothetical protein
MFNVCLSKNIKISIFENASKVLISDLIINVKYHSF